MTEHREKTDLYMIEAPDEVISGLLHVQAVEHGTIGSRELFHLSRSTSGWTLVCSLKGTLSLAGGDSVWEIRVRSALVLSSEAVQFLSSEEAAEFFAVSFAGAAADQLMVPLSEEGLHCFPNCYTHCAAFLNELEAERKHGPAISAARASGCLYHLLMNLYDQRSASPDTKSELNQVVESALGIIREDYAFLDGISELAERLEVSQEYLTRVFSGSLGITPGKYLTQVRIEHAKILLSEADYSVQFISEACGFTNANYFARVFRSLTGVSPKEYRRSRPDASRRKEIEEDSMFVL